MRFAAAAAFCLSFAAFAQTSAERPPDQPKGQVRAPPPQVECSSDSECTLTSFAGCCGTCCPGNKRVMSTKELEREQSRCAVVDCAALNCTTVKCAQRQKEPPVRPVCRAGRCVAEGLGVAECRADGDCELALPEDAACRSSPCGCCPGGEVAVPVGRPHIMEDRAPPPAPQKKKDGGPQFGLSTGSSGAAPPPNCSPCPSVRPSRAACREGKCVKAPVFMSK